MSSGLVERHIAFLEALRGAGLAVSLAEDLDAVAALSALPWGERRTVHAAYAATLVKKQSQRPTFDALFDVYFPRLVGEGARQEPSDERRRAGCATTARRWPTSASGSPRRWPTVTRRRWRGWPSRWWAGSARCPAAVPGCRSWSAYTALQRVSPGELVDRIVQALLAEGRTEEEATRVAGRRVGGFTRQVEDDARRRIAEEKGPDHVADVAIRPSIDRIDFTAARKADLEEMRREIYPLARRLATRLTQEHHARRRGPLDFRRTVRASISTGGVPLVTHHRPKRPHRNELVVLCDVSGSVANFAQFTLLLVFALRDQFQKVRAFTFIDHVHEVTQHFKPGADVVDVMADLAASTSHAALWGRTNYGRSFTKFVEEHSDALGPKSSLLILGDARSNYSDLALDKLKEMAAQRPARLVAQPRAPSALGHRRLGRREVRRRRPDGRVPQPHPAGRVRARHPLAEAR